jgi:hypothetical protein
MEPKSLIRVGYIFTAVGIILASFIMYQTRLCTEPACTMLLIYLSLIILAIATVIFVLLYILAMHMWMRERHGQN